MLFHYNTGTVLQLGLISVITTGPILFPVLFFIYIYTYIYIKSKYIKEPKVWQRPKERWMVTLTGSTEVKVEGDLRGAAVVEEHSCDNTSGVDPPEKFSLILLRTTHLRTLSPPRTHPLPPPWKQVDDCPRAGPRWEEDEVMQQKELVTMEIFEKLLWELEQRSTLCLGSGCNRLSERSLW